VAGQLNKEVALGTAKVHRFNVVRTMPADSCADLVEIVGRLCISAERCESRQNWGNQPQEKAARVAEI
jgi:hypothetical protein